MIWLEIARRNSLKKIRLRIPLNIHIHTYILNFQSVSRYCIRLVPLRSQEPHFSALSCRGNPFRLLMWHLVIKISEGATQTKHDIVIIIRLRLAKMPACQVATTRSNSCQQLLWDNCVQRGVCVMCSLLMLLHSN